MYPYDTIVFDEIFFSSIRKLARIKRYCDEHPDKIVIATGDTSQLESSQTASQTSTTTTNTTTGAST
jgi:hypothetical protein